MKLSHFLTARMRKLLLSQAVVGGCVLAVFLSPFGGFLDRVVGRGIEFRFRESLQQGPEIHPQLKILVIDNPTAQFLNGTDLPPEWWVKLIGSLQELHVKRVVVDKVFGFAFPSAEYSAKFRDLKKSDVPVLAGGFAQKRFSDRIPVSLDEPSYELSSYLKNPEDVPAWMQIVPWVLYGAHPDLREALNIGHINYFESGEVAPFLRLEPDRVVPHLAILAADEVRVENSHLWLNGKTVHLDSSGHLLVNFVSPERFLKRTLALKNQLIRLRDGVPIDAIKEGDTVLILPGASGNGDLYDTPIGRMRGGYILGAMINSLLTGNWLYPLGFSWLFILSGLALGVAVGSIKRAHTFAFALVASAVSIGGIGLICFTYFALVIPWFWQLLACVTSASVVQGMTAVDREIKGQILRQTLATLLPPTKLEYILAHPEQISFTPHEQVATIMFLDLVGFSLTAESKTPEQTFQELKGIISVIIDLVHRHSGMVDKTLGDGALCLFGYALEKGASLRGHADDALECANAIQRELLRISRENIATGGSIYPVRIGLHSAAIFLGDMGSSQKVEFTVIGRGVNFAKRMEEACEPFKIMLSASTMELLGTMRGKPDKQRAIRRRDISIKHHSRLFEAYEFDPFINEFDVLRDVLRHHSRESGKARDQDRRLLPEGAFLPVHFQMGEGVIQDYSAGGIRVEVPFYVAKGVYLLMSFRPDQCPFHSVFDQARLAQVQTIVRWGRTTDNANRFILGLEFAGLNHAQREDFVSIVHKWVEAGRELTIGPDKKKIA